MFDMHVGTPVDRRSFIAGTALGAVAAGCSLVAEDALAAGAYRPGTYTATVDGRNDIVVVETTFDQNAIVDVHVVKEFETPEVAGLALERIPAQIVEHQSLGVDAVAGATLTSEAILNAVADAVVQAGGDPEALKAVKVAQEHGETIEYDCDVVVVGGGAAGCCAATQAHDLGARVVLIEKTAGVRIGGDGFFIADSHLTREVGMDPIEVEPFYTAWMKDMCFYCDGTIVRDWFDMTRGTVPFLEEHGCVIKKALVDYSGGDSYPGGYGFHQFDIDERTTTQQMAEMVTCIEDNGGALLFETVFRNFLFDEQGAIAGIVADRNGDTVVVHAKSVVNAAGGYTGDADWMGEAYDGANPTRCAGPQTNLGDVIKRCIEIGAAPRGQDAVMTRQSILAGKTTAFTGGDNPTVYGSRFPYLPMVMNINYDGYRYANEFITAYNRNYNAKAVMAQGGYALLAITGPMIDILAEQGSGALGLIRPQGGGYDPDQTRKDRPWGPGLRAMCDDLVEQGFAYKGDTVEELATNAGIDPDVLVETYETYNKACSDGYDARFFKDSQYLYPQDEGPYYLLVHEAGVFTTLGGVRVDPKMRVMSFDEPNHRYHPIPNLFGAGTAVGAVYSDHYANCEGPCLSFCMTSGRTAGVYAVNNALGTGYKHMDLVPENL